MSHLPHGPAVLDFGYALHHFAKGFGRFPWEVEHALRRGDIEAGDVLHAMAIESADGRGMKRRREIEELKAKPVRRA